MPSKDRRDVKVYESTHKRLLDASEKSNQSLSEIIDKAVIRYLGHMSDKAEIDQLRLENEELKKKWQSLQPEQLEQPTGPSSPTSFSNLPAALTAAETSCKPTLINTIRSRPEEKQESALLFAQKLAQIRINMNREIQKDKQETIRLLHEAKRFRGRDSREPRVIYEEKGHGSYFNYGSS